MPLPSATVFPAPRRGVWDDWEDGYTRDEHTRSSRAPDDNARLWQQANTVQPTYSILPAASATNASRPPPAAALDTATTNGPPVLKILKRPTNPNTAQPQNGAGRSASSEGRPRSEKTLAEREKEYLEARRRIYGQDAAGEVQAGVAKLSVGSTTAKGTSRSNSAMAVGAGAGAGRASCSSSPAPRSNSRRGGSRSPAVGPASPAGTAGQERRGASRQPKGPNAQSGGFGFSAAAGAAFASDAVPQGSNPSSRSSSRGSRQA
ncbi:hypothetical protein JCM3774_005243 [Rhodotorula dairenensis]